VAGLVAAVDDVAGVEEVEGVGVVPPPPALSPELFLPRPPVVLPVLVLPRPGVGVDAAGAPLAGAPSFTTAEGEALAERWGPQTRYIETSSKDNINIAEAFMTVCREVVQQKYPAGPAGDHSNKKQLGKKTQCSIL